MDRSKVVEKYDLRRSTVTILERLTHIYEESKTKPNPEQYVVLNSMHYVNMYKMLNQSDDGTLKRIDHPASCMKDVLEYLGFHIVYGKEESSTMQLGLVTRNIIFSKNANEDHRDELIAARLYARLFLISQGSLENFKKTSGTNYLFKESNNTLGKYDMDDPADRLAYAFLERFQTQALSSSNTMKR